MSNANEPTRREVKIRVHDGVEIAVALYMPEGEGPFPVVLGAVAVSLRQQYAAGDRRNFCGARPGRSASMSRTATSMRIWTSRGCGKSGGEFRFLDRNEQQDLYDVIEWLGRQTWSSGKVGGIGQSYFCMLQWWMAIQKPPSLACIAAFDGLNDPYRASVYQGGMLGDFFGSYWWNQNRIINRHPANGAAPREQTCDFNLHAAAAPDLRRVLARALLPPSICTRSKCRFIRSASGARSICTPAAISTVIRHAGGPKKLKMIGPVNAFVANREFNSRGAARKIAAAVLRSLPQRPADRLSGAA